MCYILPPLAYSRTVGMLLMFGGGPEFLKGILQLWGYSVIYGGFAVLRLVRPTAGAELVAWVRIRLTEDRGETIGGGELGFPAAEPPPMDDDVARAQQEACGMNPGDAAILIQKLTKTFDARANGKRVVKRAVDELCIAVQPGEMCVSCPMFDTCLAHFASTFVHVCSFFLTRPMRSRFGLLGPNGAGKTTTVCILTGLTSPNGGAASIQGFDIASQMRSVHKVIGVCPQFDKVWPDLTVCQVCETHTGLNSI